MLSLEYTNQIPLSNADDREVLYRMLKLATPDCSRRYPPNQPEYVCLLASRHSTFDEAQCYGQQATLQTTYNSFLAYTLEDSYT
jgi:hypothetical protein